MKPHTHPCCDCHDGVALCDGEWERNDDGFPEVICSHYHRSNGATADVRCEDCDERQQQTIRDEARVEHDR